MNVSDLIPFLGHSSIYEPFDNFLNENDIKKRPKVGRNLDTSFSIEGHGITLHFDFLSHAKQLGIQVKSDGNYILHQIHIAFIAEDRKIGKYNGDFPYGLKNGDKRLDVQKKLGIVPTRTLEWGDNYFLNDLVWTISCESGDLEYIILDLPSDGFRKYGVCP